MTDPIHIDDIDELIVPSDFRAKTWSLSALQNYEGCAFKYAVGRTINIYEEPGWALQNGTEVHTLMEHYLKGDIHGIPPRLANLGKLLENLKKHKAAAEREIVLDRNWKLVDDADPWKSPNAWLRGKLDATVKLNDSSYLIVDLKTGKQYDYYRYQAELYATMIMETEPTINEITCEFWYSKSGGVEIYEFDRFDHEDRKAAWDARANKLMLERHWMPTPGDSCKWCALKTKCPAWMT